MSEIVIYKTRDEHLPMFVSNTADVILQHCGTEERKRYAMFRDENGEPRLSRVFYYHSYNVIKSKSERYKLGEILTVLEIQPRALQGHFGPLTDTTGTLHG